MVLSIGELGLAVEQLRLRGRSLIDPWVEVDDMNARRAGGEEVEHNVARGVETADVAHVAVVVCRDVEIVWYSVQPTPFRRIVTGVPTGPDAGEMLTMLVSMTKKTRAIVS